LGRDDHALDKIDDQPELSSSFEKHESQKDGGSEAETSNMLFDGMFS